ncbi:MAG: polyprenyl synthetase family protein [Candidatus Sericytochromatia bacterium]|nr:polyprenyl synthetase family protein [Candidatus Sericytochromatia bacterium]
MLQRKLRLYAAAPLWVVPELPRRMADWLGLSEDLGGELATLAFLYHCAADVIDDAQDGELASIPAWEGGDWPDAVTVGLFLLSLHSAQLAALNVSPSARVACVLAFGRAGLALSRGQHLDLRAHPEADWGEADVLAVGDLKAGGALGVLTELAPLAAGLSETAHWRALGVAAGRFFQLASDLEAYLKPAPHADLAWAKLTLPLLAARQFDPVLATVWSAGLPLDVEHQERLRLAVCQSGGLTYAKWRLEVLHRELTMDLAKFGDDALSALLAPVWATALGVVEPAPV